MELWRRSPALLMGLLLLLVAAWVQRPSLGLLFPTLLLGFSVFSGPRPRLHKAILLALLLILYALYNHHLMRQWPPQAPAASLFEQPLRVTGKALFHPTLLRPHATFYQEGWVVQGVCLDFIPTSGLEHWQRFPCSLFLPAGQSLPPLSSDFWMEGTLSLQNGSARMKSRGPWPPCETSYALAGLRHQLTQKWESTLHQYITDPDVHAFLMALTTGQIGDPLLKGIFRRAGLIHILVISGFHFSLLAYLVERALRALLPRSCATALSLLLLTLYFLFLGSTPAVVRAYLTSLFMGLCFLWRRENSGPNILGLTLSLQLLIDPASLGNIGFQLSYLATAAILIATPLCERWLEKAIPMLRTEEALSLPIPLGISYLATQLCKKMLASNLAVHLLLLPALGLHFGSASLTGLVTNLYFPLGTVLMLILFLAALPLALLLPSLGSWLLYPTQWLAELLLESLHPFCLFSCELPLSWITPALASTITALLLFFFSADFSKKNYGETNQVRA